MTCKKQVKPYGFLNLYLLLHSYEAFQPSASTLFPQSWANFCSMIKKKVLILVGRQSKGIQLSESVKIIEVCNFSFSANQL